MDVNLVGGSLHIIFAYDPDLVAKIKNMPERRWSAAKKAWVAKPTLDNIQFLRNTFPEAHWSNAALLKYAELATMNNYREKVAKGEVELDYSKLDKVQFKLQPYQHQKKALLLGRDQEIFA